jgi:diadenosine tetraphosphate (Ap4A) HIT family hydrolase
LNDIEGCLACDLTNGRRPLPGGIIFEADGWLVEHCIGPLGIGTLVVKPRAHVLRFRDLTPAEYSAFGRVLWLVTTALGDLLGPDQTYICQWAHAGWVPGHIHYVIQPVWNTQGEAHERPGPFLQVDMFTANQPLPGAEVEAFADRVRAAIAQLAAGVTR